MTAQFFSIHRPWIATRKRGTDGEDMRISDIGTHQCHQHPQLLHQHLPLVHQVVQLISLSEVTFHSS